MTFLKFLEALLHFGIASAYDRQIVGNTHEDVVPDLIELAYFPGGDDGTAMRLVDDASCANGIQ